MNLCLGLLLATAVCVEMAHGLSCYTCGTPATSSECKQETNCSALSPRLGFCKTTVMSPDVGFPFTGSETVFRQCVESCMPTGENWLGVTKKIMCCNLDYCNRQGIQEDSSSTDIDPCPKNNGAAATPSLMTATVLISSTVIYSLQ